MQHTHEISQDDKGYKRFNHFVIHDDLKEILFDDYYLYQSKEFDKTVQIEELYKKNFIDKYDRETQAEFFEKFIDNEKFKEKVLFIYSMVDFDKYKVFVQNNPEINNPNDLSIIYSILDSSGVKVQIYNINISEIAFVF